MVDQNDTRFDKRDANSPRVGLDGTVPTANRFNVEVERGAELAQASDKAKQMIDDHTIVRDSRMDDQLEREEKYQEYGRQKEKSKLLEKQFTSPQPIPDDPKAREIMHKEINEGAVRNNDKRNQYFRDQIDTQYEKSVDEILKMDREGRLPEHNLGQKHAQEHNQDMNWEGR